MKISYGAFGTTWEHSVYSVTTKQKLGGAEPYSESCWPYLAVYEKVIGSVVTIR